MVTLKLKRRKQEGRGLAKRSDIAPRSMTDLQQLLAQLFAGRASGEVDSATTKDLCNAAGKMIKIAVSQYEYAHLRGEVPDVPFMK